MGKIAQFKTVENSKLMSVTAMGMPQNSSILYLRNSRRGGWGEGGGG